MAYNYSRQPVMGYQGGGKAGGGWGHWHDDVEFDEDAYGGGMRTGFTGYQGGGAVPPMRPLVPYPPAILAQGFQRGGRVGRALSRASAGSAQLKSNLALEDAMEALTAAKDKATGWWDTAGSWIKGLGSAAQIASNFIPGVGPLISTGIGAGVEGLGTVIADKWAPEFEVPQDIIDRQTGAAGPVIGRRNWEKLQEGYGDLSEFSRSAGRKMRAATASDLPARYLKAKTADMMMKQLQGTGGGGGGVNIDQIPQMEVNMPQYTPPTIAPSVVQDQLPFNYGNWFPRSQGSTQLGNPSYIPSGSTQLGGGYTPQIPW